MCNSTLAWPLQVRERWRWASFVRLGRSAASRRDSPCVRMFLLSSWACCLHPADRLMGLRAHCANGFSLGTQTAANTAGCAAYRWAQCRGCTCFTSRSRNRRVDTKMLSSSNPHSTRWSDALSGNRDLLVLIACRL